MAFEQESPLPRLAYLVRCWPVETENGLVWRASVESPYTTDHRTFASLSALFAFIEKETESLVPTEKEASR
jgi:hypothetical protein